LGNNGFKKLPLLEPIVAKMGPQVTSQQKLSEVIDGRRCATVISTDMYPRMALDAAMTLYVQE
jgi:hypothetical protein